jgi:nitrogen fixation protein NifB
MSGTKQGVIRLLYRQCVKYQVAFKKLVMSSDLIRLPDDVCLFKHEFTITPSGMTILSKGINYMAQKCEGLNRIHGHPCFDGDHQRNGRIHVPVAPRCNIKCRYCTRRHDCVNETRPGVTSRLISPDEALEKVRQVMASPVLGPIIKVVGIAGPGDPLANRETFETFRLVGREFPQLLKCLSTNGLLLPDTIEDLYQIGLGSLTVTVNSLNPNVGAKIYSWFNYGGRRYSGIEGAALLVSNQLAGIERAAGLGIVVKVNSVFIPGINEDEIELIAREAGERGASVMNIMPLIPQAEFAGIIPPSIERIEAVRRANNLIIGQFRHCRQCRADAVGLVGSNETMDRYDAQTITTQTYIGMI